MSKFTVEFTIEADSLGHATNRALVALYKGDLDAEDVKVSQKGQVITPGGSPPGTYASGGYVRGGEIKLDVGEITYTKEELKNIVKNRKILREPHKDTLD